MNLEFWILDGIQTLRTPAGDVLMPFITSFGNGGVIWIVLTVILLLIPKTRKTGLILGAALILDGILCNLLLKNLMRRIRPCDINDAADAISQGKAAFLGCVLNNMQTGFRFGRTSAYGYGGYGYGYGYGSEKQGSRTEGRGR